MRRATISICFRSVRSLKVRIKSNAEWMEALMARVEATRQFRGVPYLAVPMNADLTPGKSLQMCVAIPDSKSLVLVFGEEELKHAFPERPAEQPGAVARLRRSVEGGVLTVVLPAESLKRHNLSESDEPGDKAADELLRHVEVVALGADISPDNRLAVRLRGNYPNAEQARDAELQAQTLVRLAQDALSKVGTIFKVENEVPKQVDGGVTFYRELLQNHKLSVEVQADGTADLVLESNGSGWFERQ